jgi:hypothetical protein
MGHSVSEKLCQVICEYGKSLCNDPKRCEALLRDFCPKERDKINVLISALKEGVGQILCHCKKEFRGSFCVPGW